MSVETERYRREFSVMCSTGYALYEKWKDRLADGASLDEIVDIYDELMDHVEGCGECEAA